MSEEDSRFTGAVLTGSCEQFCVDVGHQNMDLLEEEQVLFPAKPSIQPGTLSFCVSSVPSLQWQQYASD